MRDSDSRVATPSSPGGEAPAAGDAPPPAPVVVRATKPVPVRQAAPPPARPRQADDRSADPQPKPAPVRDKGPPRARPAPARGSVPPGSAKPPAARDAGPPPARNLERTDARRDPARDVRLGEETWTVRLKGAATVGSGHAGARILSVAFEAPGGATDADETRYVLGRSLEDVGEDELLSLVREVARKPGETTESARRRRPAPDRKSGRRRRRT